MQASGRGTSSLKTVYPAVAMQYLLKLHVGTLHLSELDSQVSQQLQMLHVTLTVLFKQTCSADAACDKSVNHVCRSHLLSS